MVVKIIVCDGCGLPKRPLLAKGSKMLCMDCYNKDIKKVEPSFRNEIDNKIKNIPKMDLKGKIKRDEDVS